MTETHSPDWIDQQLKLADSLRPHVQPDSDLRLGAVTAKYEARKKLIHVGLQNGASFSFPPALAQGLQNATAVQLAHIDISPLGTGLSWPLLDVDLTVEGLLKGVFGSQGWMRAHAAKAGRVRSEAKASASRRNGALGGRPRKQRPMAV
jgi:hypothetical protein